MGVALADRRLDRAAAATRPATGCWALGLAAVVAVYNAGDFTWLRVKELTGLDRAIPRGDLKTDALGGYAALARCLPLGRH